MYLKKARELLLKYPVPNETSDHVVTSPDATSREAVPQRQDSETQTSDVLVQGVSVRYRGEPCHRADVEAHRGVAEAALL